MVAGNLLRILTDSPFGSVALEYGLLRLDKGLLSLCAGNNRINVGYIFYIRLFSS